MERIFYICGLKRDKASIIDKRISLALKVINDNDITNDNLLEKIIHKVNLSKSRFLHLFKDNIGISFKDFVLTKKFLKTWIYLAQGESITDACIHGGFFDSAHYTHFMSQCFGLTTKDELKNIDSIYVVDKF